MKLYQFAASVAVIALLFSSCGDEVKDRYPGYEKKEGTEVYFKKHKSGNGAAAADSDLIWVFLKYCNDSDSVLIDDRGEIMPMLVLKPKFKGDFFEFLVGMKVGDSMTVRVPVDSMRQYYKKDLFTKEIDSGGYLGLVVKLDSITPKKVFLEKQALAQKNAMYMDSVHSAAEAKMPELIKQDKALLPKFIREHNIKEKADEKGLIFIESAHVAGPLITMAQAVKIHYKGYFLDGTVFDQSNAFPGNDPAVFQMGQLAPGFSALLTRMTKGSKAMFIIPSEQCYNDGVTRVFEVEVLDVR